MSCLKQACAWVAALLMCTSVAAVESPAHISRYETTPQDVNAIMQLTQDLRTALAAKDVNVNAHAQFGHSDGIAAQARDGGKDS